MNYILVTTTIAALTSQLELKPVISVNDTQPVYQNHHPYINPAEKTRQLLVQSMITIDHIVEKNKKAPTSKKEIRKELKIIQRHELLEIFNTLAKPITNQNLIVSIRNIDKILEKVQTLCKNINASQEYLDKLTQLHNDFMHVKEHHTASVPARL